MNYDQYTGIIRAIAPAVVAYLVGKGWITSDTAGLIVTAVVAFGAAVWSVINNRVMKSA